MEYGLNITDFRLLLPSIFNVLLRNSQTAELAEELLIEIIKCPSNVRRKQTMHSILLPHLVDIGQAVFLTQVSINSVSGVSKILSAYGETFSNQIVPNIAEGLNEKFVFLMLQMAQYPGNEVDNYETNRATFDFWRYFNEESQAVMENSQLKNISMEFALALFSKLLTANSHSKGTDK
jgi:hypothetical protein